MSTAPNNASAAAKHTSGAADNRRGSANQTAVDTIASTCVAVRLRMLNRVISKLFDDALRPLDLKISQLNILVVAAKAGLARPTDVCRMLHLERSTLSRNVERMLARGWLEVVPGDDARAQPFRLTPQGKKLLERAVPAWAAGQRRAAELLGKPVVAGLEKTAAKLGANSAKRRSRVGRSSIDQNCD